MFVVKNIAIQKKAPKPFAYLRKPAIWICLFVFSFGQTHRIASADEEIAPVVQEEAVTPAVSEGETEPAQVDEQSEGEGEEVMGEESVATGETDIDTETSDNANGDQEQITGEQTLFSGEETIVEQNVTISGVPHILPAIGNIENIVAEPFLPKDLIWLQDGELMIDETSVSAKFKKDSDLKIREIQFQQRTVVTGEDAGVTITIPEDTKVFAPVTQEDEQAVEVQTLTTGDDTIGDQVNELMQEQALSGLVAPESMENISVQSLVSEESTITTTEIDPMEGQAPLASEEMLIQEHAVKETEGLITPETIEKVYTFGFADQHLIFTKPVQMTISLPDVSDGEVVQLQVKHKGDTGYNMAGLSANAETECDENGNTTLSGESMVVVKDHQATFYTCGASEFTVGTISVPFNPAFNNTLSALVVQSDGSVVAAGTFTAVSGLVRNRIARITVTGSVDTLFDPNMNNTINAMVRNSDDSIVIAGAFTTGGANMAMIRVAKISSTGMLFTGGQFTGNTNNIINAIDLQPDGSMIIGGIFTVVNNQARGRVARITFSGQVDPNFTGNLNNAVNAIKVQPDGKVLLGGIFTTASAFPMTGIVRVDATGYVDRSFTGNSSGVLAIDVQADGKIIMGGNFTTVVGGTRSFLARTTSTGLLDTSFVATVNGAVNVVKVMNDGRIMVGGAFTIANSQNVGRLVIFFPDGTLDTTFVPLLNAPVSTLALDTLQQSVFIGGTFTFVDAASKSRFARLGILPSTCLGLTGCALWLKADAGVEFGGGNGVTGWTTQAGQDGVAGQPTGAWQPQFITGGMNYNPSLSFDGSGSAFVMPVNFADLDMTQYVVMRSRSLSGTMTVTTVGVPLTSVSCDRSFMMSGGKFTTYLGAERRFSTGMINDSIPKILGWKYGSGITQTLTVQGKTDGYGTGQRPTQVSEANLQIGRAPIGCLSGASYSGDIAEIMSFSRALTTGEELVVQSYLGLKYGIALDQTIPTDYVVRSGNSTITLWNALSGGIYDFDMAGVARSDALGLYQNRSKSMNYSGEISVYVTGGIANNQGLVWANQGGTTGLLVTGLAVTGYLSILRVWHFQERQGDIGRVELSYYSGAIPTFGTGKLIMFVASGGGLLTGASVEIYTGTLDGDTWKFSFNPTDNTVITFGYVDEDQPPYDIRALSGAMKEQLPIGSFVTNLSSLDPNAQDTGFTYTFDTGGCAGTLDNDKFTITGSQLFTNYYFQDMIQHQVNICVRSTDSRGLYATGFLTLAIQPFLPISIVDSGYANIPAGTVFALATQFDNSLLLGGTFTNVGAATRNRIARLSSTGLLDSAFDPNANGQVNAIIVQANSGILIAGAFTTVGGVSRTNIARLTVTGQLDLNFNTVTNGTIGAMVEQPDGSIVIGGAFTTVAGVTRNHMARISSTGQLDPNYNPNVSAAGTVSGLALQPDGQVIIVGTYSTVSGIPKSGIARVTSTGQLDPIFTGVTPNSAVNTVVLQPDGSMFFGGTFTTIGTTARSRIARVTSTGLVDSFNPNIVGSSVSSIVAGPDGNVYIGGVFSSVQGVSRTNFTRVDYSGNLDLTFDVYVNNSVQAMVFDGWSVDIGGLFTQINIGGDGSWIYPKARIARVGIAPSACGGFGGCSTWLKADTGVIASATGLGVSGWLSQAVYNAVSGVQATQSLMPSYVTGAMNFNPVIRFISGTHLFMAKQMNGQDATQFTVFRNTYNTGVVTVVGNTKDTSPTLCDRGLMLSGGRLMTLLSGQRVLSTVPANTNAAMLASWSYGTGFGQTLGLQGSGNTGGTSWRQLLTMGSLTGDGLLIGNSNCTTARGAFSGDIAEIITFERRLSNTEMNMMNSYLALKYGITLDQTAAPMDYVLTGDLVVWSAASGGIYNHDIAGVGRHDVSSLYQQKSQSSNDRFDIIVGFTGSIANNKILVWANDGGMTTGFLVTGTIIDGYVRTPRTWRFQERNGDVGNVEISYYSGSLQNFGDGTLYMFVSSGDNSFTGAGTLVHTGTLDGNKWTFSLNPDDATTITFGYLNGNHRPYDLETSSLTMKEKLPVGSVVSVLSTQDPNQEDTLFTYTFDTSCAGTLDNSKFTIAGDQLLTNYYFQDMNQHIANVCLRTTDTGGLYLTGLFTFFIQPFVALGAIDPVVPQVAGGPVYALDLERNGSIIVGGSFNQIVFSTRQNIARLTATGAVDPDFNPNPNAAVNAVLAQSNGGVVIGGEFNRVSGTQIVRNYIARMTSTGRIDTTFDGPFMDAPVSALLEQGDKIIAGGAFTTVGGAAMRGIGRLTSTGQVDLNFTGLINSTGSVSGLVLQPDGNILVGGRFTTVGGEIRGNIARITATGQIDKTFTGVNTNNLVSAIAVQSDGSIIFGGAFTTVGATTRNRIARVSSTGLLDANFDPNINGAVRSIIISDDGSILIGGVFTSVQGVARGNFARVNSGGLLDTTLDVYAESGVYAMISDGRSVDIGGVFVHLSQAPGATRWVQKQRLVRIGLAPSVCGGFGGCSTWLKADTGVIASATGLGVSGWLSQAAYNTISGVQTTQSLMPSYVTGAINFNPVIRFTSGTHLFMAKQMNGQDATQFTVFRNIYNTGVLTVVGNTTDTSPTLCERGLIVSGGRLMTLLSGQRVLSTVAVNTNAPTLASWSYGTGFGQTLGLQGSGNTGGSAWREAVNMGNLTGAGLLIGNSNCAAARGGYSGDIAEIITFERRLSSTEMNMMNSYLALKYGITLDQTAVPMDYVLSGGITAWSALSGGIYNRDIAGIGRNDASSLSQRKSRSENSRSDLIVEFTGTAFTNNALLVWANDGDATGAWLIDNITTGYKRIERTWQFQERNNDINFVNVYVASGSVPPLTGNTLYMFVHTGGDAFMETTTKRYTGTLVNNSWKFIAGISNDSYVTFGYAGNNQPSTDLALSPLTMNEKLTTGAVVGTFTTTDPDDSSFTYTFDTTCAGTLDNDKFTISDDELLTNYYFQYDVETSATVCIKTTDSVGHTLTGVFTIDILPTSLSMAAPASLLFTGLWRPAFNVQTFEQNFSNDTTKYFKVADGLGADAGYTTTLQLDGNLTSGSSTISAANVYFKSTSADVDTIAGSPNPRVDIDAAALSYQPLNHATNFILRDTAANSSVMGVYGTYIWMQVALPAEQPIGQYQGTLVYTLIEN